MAERYILILENEAKLRGLMDKIVSLEGYQVLEVADQETSVLRILSYTKGNKMEAARLLNIGLTTVYRKIIEYDLE